LFLAENANLAPFGETFSVWLAKTYPTPLSYPSQLLTYDYDSRSTLGAAVDPPPVERQDWNIAYISTLRKKLRKNASPDQTRSQPLRLGNHRLPQLVRKLPTRKPLRSDAERRPRRRMQDLYPAFHSLSVEGRSHSSHKTNEYMPDLRTAEKLLPVLYA
jgi:hypothetical protein